MPPPRASVIVTTYNQPRFLEILLESLRRQTVRDFEVVIGDDGSDRPTKNLIESQRGLPFALKHHWQPDEGFRVGEARNGAIRLSESDWLIFVDGDLALHPQFVEAHLKLSGVDRVLFGGRLKLNRDFSDGVTLQQVKEHGIEHLVGRSLSHCRERQYAPVAEGLGDIIGGKLVQNFAGKPRPFWNKALNGLSLLTTRWLFQNICFKSGSNFSTSRSLVEKVNGFDRRFRDLSGEDGEFFWRLFHAGAAPKSVLFTAIAYHFWHPENWERIGEQRKRSLEIERETRLSKRIRCECGLVEEKT